MYELWYDYMKPICNKNDSFVTHIKMKIFIKILKDTKTILKSQQRFKSEAHNVYTEEVNKIALSSNDDKRLQAYDGIPTYPYGYKLIQDPKYNIYK